MIMAGNDIVITEEMVHDFNKKQMPSILRYDTSGNLLGNSIDRTGDSPFQQLSEEEKEARIKNYIEKNKGRIFNRDENELRNKCEQEYNSQACGENKYMLDERKIYLHTIGGMNPLYEDILAILLKDSDIQAELKKFHESDHEEEDRKSFYRIRKVEGMSGHMYIYEDWSVFISKLPTTNTKLLFEVSSLGKISKLEISIADLYR